MDRREQEPGRRRNTLTRPRTVLTALAVVVGGVAVERADAAINGITTPAKTTCNNLGRGVFRATNNSNTPVNGYLVSIDKAGNPTVVDSTFMVPAKDETVSILPTSEEDKQIVFVANDGSGVTNPTENDCIAGSEQVSTTTSTVPQEQEEEPVTTTSSIPSTTTTTSQPPTTSSSTVPVTTSTTLPYGVSGETTVTTLQDSSNVNQAQAGVDDYIPTAPVAVPSQGRTLALVG